MPNLALVINLPPPVLTLINQGPELSIGEQSPNVTISDPVNPASLAMTPVFKGEKGDPGTAGRHEHTQALVATAWTVAHNFGYWPQVQIFSNGGKEMIAEVLHMSLNVTNLYFDDPVSGIAIFE